MPFSFSVALWVGASFRFTALNRSHESRKKTNEPCRITSINPTDEDCEKYACPPPEENKPEPVPKVQTYFAPGPAPLSYGGSLTNRECLDRAGLIGKTTIHLETACGHSVARSNDTTTAFGTTRQLIYMAPGTSDPILFVYVNEQGVVTDVQSELHAWARHDQCADSPPWTVEELEAGFKIVDGNGQTLAYVYGHLDPRDAQLPRGYAR